MTADGALDLPDSSGDDATVEENAAIKGGDDAAATSSPPAAIAHEVTQSSAEIERHWTKDRKRQARPAQHLRVPDPNDESARQGEREGDAPSSPSQ